MVAAGYWSISRYAKNEKRHRIGHLLGLECQEETHTQPSHSTTLSIDLQQSIRYVVS